MSSPSNITSPPNKKARQRILEAATASFQSLGYARTTTQAIAAQAGVAEVTVFRHFGNKQKLFQTVSFQIGGAIGLDRIEAQLNGDIHSDLLLISKHVLSKFFEQQDAIRMLMFESTHFPEMQEALAQNPRELLHFLIRYFSHQIELGRVKNIDQQGMAHTFISMLFGYAVGLEPMGAFLPAVISHEEMTTNFVNIFLDGVVKTNSESIQGDRQ